MKIDKLVDLLKNYEGFDVDFRAPNGDKLSIYEFWSIGKVKSVTVVLKHGDD